MWHFCPSWRAGDTTLVWGSLLASFRAALSLILVVSEAMRLPDFAVFIPTSYDLLLLRLPRPAAIVSTLYGLAELEVYLAPMNMYSFAYAKPAQAGTNLK